MRRNLQEVRLGCVVCLMVYDAFPAIKFAPQTPGPPRRLDNDDRTIVYCSVNFPTLKRLILIIAVQFFLFPLGTFYTPCIPNFNKFIRVCRSTSLKLDYVKRYIPISNLLLIINYF